MLELFFSLCLKLLLLLLLFGSLEDFKPFSFLELPEEYELECTYIAYTLMVNYFVEIVVYLFKRYLSATVEIYFYNEKGFIDDKNFCTVFLKGKLHNVYYNMSIRGMRWLLIDKCIKIPMPTTVDSQGEKCKNDDNGDLLIYLKDFLPKEVDSTNYYQFSGNFHLQINDQQAMKHSSRVKIQSYRKKLLLINWFLEKLIILKSNNIIIEKGN